MGLFGKKKSKDGAEYADVETANENLPVAVATPVVVASAPPASKDPSAHIVSLPPPQQQQLQQHHSIPDAQHLIISREPSPLMPCMYCGRNARTRVTTYPNWVTWCLVGLLLFLFWPLFWLPVSFLRHWPEMICLGRRSTHAFINVVVLVFGSYLVWLAVLVFLTMRLLVMLLFWPYSVGYEFHAKIGTLLQHVQRPNWRRSTLRRLLRQTPLASRRHIEGICKRGERQSHVCLSLHLLKLSLYVGFACFRVFYTSACSLDAAKIQKQTLNRWGWGTAERIPLELFSSSLIVSSSIILWRAQECWIFYPRKPIWSPSETVGVLSFQFRCT